SRRSLRNSMRPLALLGLVAACSSCSSSAGPEEVKLSKRSRDAGPPVIVVDKLTAAVGQTPVEEKEPNDAKSGGQPRSLPGPVPGGIDKAEDWDVYKVAIPQPGTLRATLTAVDDADLVLEVQGPGGEVMAVSDDGPAKIAEAIPNLFVQPGTVNVVVHEYVKPAKAPPKKKKGAPPPPAPTSGRTQPSHP